MIDRRAEPSHGYRAVHVIVFVEDAAVEIQVRTRWQHEWAELFEKLADKVGRGIRYGEPPELTGQAARRPGEGGRVADLRRAQLELISILVDWAQTLGNHIDAYEQEPHPRLLEIVEESLADLRAAMENL